METRPEKLGILAAVLVVVLAFVLRAVIPQNLFLPGGWPLGSHWYRTGWVLFWLFLIVGLTLGAILLIKFASRDRGIR
jgi:hypothetical protein